MLPYWNLQIDLAESTYYSCYSDLSSAWGFDKAELIEDIPKGDWSQGVIPALLVKF